MIRVSVLYPRKEGARFNIDYYMKNHIPMLQEKLGSACKRIIVERGLNGGVPGSKPTYVIVSHMMFESLEAYRTAIKPHASEITADVSNYSAVKPVIQVSEVKFTRGGAQAE